MSAKRSSAASSIPTLFSAIGRRPTEQRSRLFATPSGVGVGHMALPPAEIIRRRRARPLPRTGRCAIREQIPQAGRREDVVRAAAGAHQPGHASGPGDRATLLRPVYVSPVLTKLTGVTMGFLRFRRWIWHAWGEGVRHGEVLAAYTLHRLLGAIPLRA
jgi:hypothetical protein